MEELPLPDTPEYLREISFETDHSPVCLEDPQGSPTWKAAFLSPQSGSPFPNSLGNPSPKGTPNELFPGEAETKEQPLQEGEQDHGRGAPHPFHYILPRLPQTTVHPA